MIEKQVKFGSGLEGILTGNGKAGPVILLHGAGKGMDTPLFEKTASELAKLKHRVLRFNFSYLGKKSAPSKDGKKERPEIVEAIEFMKKYGNPILIGKSFGARISTYVAAERDDIRALVYYGLPLHGMAKDAKLRDFSHLKTVKAPMLFITGDKDRLCSQKHLATVQKFVKSKYKSLVIPGNHSFKPKSEDEAIRICIDWVESLKN